MIMYNSRVSIRNVLKLLFNFTVNSIRASLQEDLYWSSMLIFFTSLSVIEYYKDTDYQMLDQFPLAKSC